MSKWKLYQNLLIPSWISSLHSSEFKYRNSFRCHESTEARFRPKPRCSNWKKKLICTEMWCSECNCNSWYFLVDLCITPQAWSWPGRGSAVADLSRHLLQPVPRRPVAGAALDAFLSAVGRLPTPHPHQLTMGSAVQTPSSYPLRLAGFFPRRVQHRPQHQRDLPTLSPSQAWPLDFRFLFLLHPLPQHLPLCLHHPSLTSHPFRPLHLCWLHLQTFRQWLKTGRTPSSWWCRTGCRFWWVMLHPSRPRVPLFRRGIWTPTSCGSWVPLVTERHHGLNISLVQSEQTVAPDPGALQVIGLRPAETVGLVYETSVPHHHCCPNGWEPIAVAQYAALALRMTVGEALVNFAIVLLLSLTSVIEAVPLPHTPNVVGPEIAPLSSVLPGPAWLGDLPGMCPCHPDAVLRRTRRCDHPGAVVRRPTPGGCPLITADITPPPGHLHLNLSGDRVPILAVHAPGLRQRHLHEADQRLLRLRDASPVSQQDEDLDADQNSSADDSRLSAEAVKKLFDDLLCPPALSHYADPYPATDLTNTQLVSYNKDAAKATSARNGDELDTHDGLFTN